MAKELRFDGRVAIVTGAGNGLGREYALLFASRGAKVVVNDLGGSSSGEGASQRAADTVVEEIKKAGGEAVANYDSVEFGEKIVQTAIKTWGRVDIVVNNAGILRDASFMKMQDKDWELIYKIHLYGSYSVTKAAWNYMREQNYGRIIMVSSAAGIYGNFGQANYGAMKAGLVGFCNALSKEGAKRNTFVNTIAPIARSRMTESLLPPDLLDALKPEFVAPLVAYLCHESCTDNGGVWEVGAGWVGRVRYERAEGKVFNLKDFSAEAIRDSWGKINDFTSAPPSYPVSTPDSTNNIMAVIEKQKNANQAAQAQATAVSAPKKRGNEHVDLDKVQGYEFPVAKFGYDERDVALYALSVGSAKNPLDESELNFVYENAPSFQPLPTMAVIFPFKVLAEVLNVPGLSFNPMMLLHGEQELVLKKTPLPRAAQLTNHAKISGLYDKGKDKGGVLVVDVVTKNQDGEEIAVNRITSFIRGIGGFGGERGPAVPPPSYEPPKRKSDVVEEEKTQDNQALWYRLGSGDLNPLHADPSMAAIGGFSKPILHGLCTFGYAGRAVLKHFCNNDPTRFKSIKARFSKSVFPGETIVTEIWKTSPSLVVFQCKVKERDVVVLTNGAVEIQPDSKL